MALAAIGSSPPGSRNVYDRLQGSEIRLVKFERNSSDPSSIQMRLEKFEMNEAPPYIALSYVWGDATDTQSIEVGLQSLQITRNLFSALVHIRSLSRPLEDGLSRHRNGGGATLFLWVDAICINQEDIGEKSDQVPRMTEIYASAYSVLIWLGTIEDLELTSLTFHLLLIMLDKVGSADGFANQERPFAETLAHEYPALVTSHLLAGYVQIVLSNGSGEYGFFKSIRWSLYGLGENFRQFVDHPNLLIRAIAGPKVEFALGVAKIAFGPIYMRDWFASREFQEKSLAHQLLWIYMNIGLKASTVPHDQIYGLLGMVKHQQLPLELAVDYQQPYERVCKKFTRYLVEQTGDLRPLAFIDNTPKLEGQPSWIIDFRFVNAWGHEPTTSSSASFSADGLKMIMEGVVCGKIVLHFRDAGHPHRRMQRFYNTILTASSTIRQQSLPQTWKEWFSNFLTSCGQSVDHADRFESAADFLATVREDDQYEVEDGLNRAIVMTMFGEGSFALVDDGKVTRCSLRKDQRLDREWELVMLKGAMQRYIVSRTEENEFIYVGGLSEVDFTLDGINYILDNVDSTLDEGLFARFRTERIVLV